MSLQYNYNRTGAERKALVHAASEILGQPAVYQGAPTFAYAIGRCSVDRNGVLAFAGNTNPEEAARLIDSLRERGYIPENAGAAFAEEPVDAVPEETASEALPTEAATGADTTDTNPDDALVIEIPKDGFSDSALDNLHKIVAGKEPLLKKAIGTDNLSIIDTGGTLKFPWFTLHGLENEADAYSRLITAICSMAKERKRIVAKECVTDNDKFTMRLFLVQLGFIGDEYKAARKILLRNLSGNSSWKSGHAPERSAADTEPPSAPPADGPNTASENADAETGDAVSGHEKGGEAYDGQ